MQRAPSFWVQQQGLGLHRGAPGMESQSRRICAGRAETALIDDVLVLNESPLLGGRQSSQSPRYLRGPHEQRTRSSLNPARWSASTTIDEVVILDDGSAALQRAVNFIRRPVMRPPEGEDRTREASSGLTEEMVMKHLRRGKYAPSSAAFAVEETCCICQEDYSKGEDVGELSCGHSFHADCVGRWLTQKNVCPICRKTALPPIV